MAEISRVCSVGNARGWRNIQIAFGAAKNWEEEEARMLVSIRFIRRYRASTVVRLLMNQEGRVGMRSADFDKIMGKIMLRIRSNFFLFPLSRKSRRSSFFFIYLFCFNKMV